MPETRQKQTNMRVILIPAAILLLGVATYFFLRQEAVLDLIDDEPDIETHEVEPAPEATDGADADAMPETETGDSKAKEAGSTGAPTEDGESGSRAATSAGEAETDSGIDAIDEGGMAVDTDTEEREATEQAPGVEAEPRGDTKEAEAGAGDDAAAADMDSSEDAAGTVEAQKPEAQSTDTGSGGGQTDPDAGESAKAQEIPGNGVEAEPRGDAKEAEAGAGDDAAAAEMDSSEDAAGTVEAQKPEAQSTDTGSGGGQTDPDAGESAKAQEIPGNGVEAEPRGDAKEAEAGAGDDAAAAEMDSSEDAAAGTVEAQKPEAQSTDTGSGGGQTDPDAGESAKAQEIPGNGVEAEPRGDTKEAEAGVGDDAAAADIDSSEDAAAGTVEAQKPEAQSTDTGSGGGQTDPEVTAPVQSGTETEVLSGADKADSPVPQTAQSQTQSSGQNAEAETMRADASEALDVMEDDGGSSVESTPGETVALLTTDPVRSDQNVEMKASAVEDVEAVPDPPTFDVVRIDQYGIATIAGRSAAHSTVQILVNDVPAAESIADGRGNFVAIFSVDVTAGPLEIALNAILPSGLALTSSSSVIVFPSEFRTVGSAEPESSGQSAGAPVETTFKPVQPAILMTSLDGLQLMQPPLPPLHGNRLVEMVTYDSKGEAILAGRASELNRIIRIYVDNAHIKDAHPKEDLSWSADLSEISPGRYTLRVDEVDTDGKPVGRIEMPLQKEGGEYVLSIMEDAAAHLNLGQGVDTTPFTQLVTVQRGYTLWGISRGRFGLGRLYVNIFELNKDQIKDPDLIYPGQIFKIPQTSELYDPEYDRPYRPEASE